MIAYLKGIYKYNAGDYIVIDIGGVGYKVFVPSTTLLKLPSYESEVTLYTYQHVREDALQLFGFTNREELDLFELLLNVSGIGPKVALTILSSIEVSKFRQAVLQEQVSLLTGIPGIGKKTAQRMILELKDKLLKTLSEEINNEKQLITDDSTKDALKALVSLGYNQAEARKALQKLSASDRELDVEELIKLALRELARM